MGVIRRVTKIGNSLWVSLPKGWADVNNVKDGTEVELEATENGLLIKIRR